MAQQFQADSQMLAANVTITTTTETTGPVTNPVRVPYLNGKFHVFGTVIVTSGGSTTALVVRVRRNAAAENVVVTPSPQNINVTAGNIVAVGFDFTDAVPDGRDCIYSVTVTQVGAVANGTILAGSTISAVALSG